MAMKFNIDWSVRGSSTVEFTDDEVAEAGVDPDQDDVRLFRALNTFFHGDPLQDAVSDFDERDAPELIETVRISEDGWIG